MPTLAELRRRLTTEMGQGADTPGRPLLPAAAEITIPTPAEVHANGSMLPVWKLRHAQDLMKRAAKLGEARAQHKFGKGPRELAKDRASKLEAAIRGMPDTAIYEVSVNPNVEPVHLTEPEIFNITRDPVLAADVYARVMHTDSPDPHDVSRFVDNLKAEFPFTRTDIGPSDFHARVPVFASDTLNDELKAAKDYLFSETPLPRNVEAEAIIARDAAARRAFGEDIRAGRRPRGSVFQRTPEQEAAFDRATAAVNRVRRGTYLSQLQREHPEYTPAQIKTSLRRSLTAAEEYVQDRVRRGVIRSPEDFSILDYVRDTPGGLTVPMDVMTQYLHPAIKHYFVKKQQADAEAAAAPARERIPALSPEQLTSLHRRTAVPQQVRDVELSAATIAPRNALHREAEKLLRETAGDTHGAGRAHQEALRTLRGSDILPDVRTELTAAARNPVTDIERYFNPYRERVMENLLRRGEEDWRTKIAPSISDSFAIMGNTRSGAHAKALERARTEHDERVRDRMDKLAFQGYEQALKAGEAQQAAALSRAQVVGNAHTQQQAHRRQTELLGLQGEDIAKRHKMLDAEARAKLALQRQLQEQAEINEKLRIHDKGIQDEERQLLMEAAIGRDQTLPVMHTPPSVPVAPPAPPNAYSFASGLLGTLAGFPGQQQQMYKGGRAKRKFAGGGLIPSWQELSKQLTPDKYAPQQEAIAHQLQNYQFNPMQNWMSHVGAQQLQNLSDPIGGMGRGSQLAIKDRENAYNASLESKYRAASLYDKMNESLRHQQHFIADYEAKRAHHDEVKRHHGAIESYNNAKLGLKQNAADQLLEQYANLSPEESMQMRSTHLKPAQQKISEEAFKELIEGAEMEQKAAEGEKLYGKLSTGPLLGRMPNWMSSLVSKGSLEDRDLAEQLSNELAYQTSQSSKGRGSNMQLGLIQSMKGAPTNTTERNVASMKNIKKYGNTRTTAARNKLMRLGYTKAEIDSVLENHLKTGIEETMHEKPERHKKDLSHYSNEELMRIAAGG